MYEIVLVIHVIIAAGLIGLILLQQGKGAQIGAAFGSGASNTVFGSPGSGNFLTRSTAIMATLFFATSISLSYIAVRHGKVESVSDEDLPVIQQTVPAKAPVTSPATSPATPPAKAPEKTSANEPVSQSAAQSAAQSSVQAQAPDQVPGKTAQEDTAPNKSAPDVPDVE